MLLYHRFIYIWPLGFRNSCPLNPILIHVIVSEWGVILSSVFKCNDTVAVSKCNAFPLKSSMPWGTPCLLMILILIDPICHPLPTQVYHFYNHNIFLILIYRTSYVCVDTKNIYLLKLSIIYDLYTN